MHFIHDPYIPGETIAAVATPPGEGGVAIIRISGDNALVVAAKVFSGPIHKYASHTAHYGQIRDFNGQVVDDVLVLVMLGKRSFTGENTVEVHCHGGALITKRVLETILKAGARAARPGEFSFKAYMNGKLDLAQAEAIQELICAKNDRALDAAEQQLRGGLSKKVQQLQQDLTLMAAILEAWVDFPEEGLEFTTLEEMSESLKKTASQMQAFIETYHDGKILHDGIALCLVGAPNVGKSSLMNALLDKERAIVSPIAGTTRDVLEDHLRLNGLNFRIIDTAGIRATEEIVEKEGIRRSKLALAEADLVLLVLDASRPLEAEDIDLIEQVPADKTLFVWNKMDVALTIPSLDNVSYQAFISAQYKTGICELKTLIDQIIWHRGPPSKEEVLITNVRHYEALKASLAACQRVVEGLSRQVSPEFLSLDMRTCLHELGKIIGTNIGEDILSSIFSTFCIGK